jgi:hypothetical protein
MGLSCSYNEDPDWWYMCPDDFTFYQGKKRKRCCSCKQLLNIGVECLQLDRWKEKDDDGSEIELAPWYMCAECGEQFLNLSALGYCIDPAENMFELLREYQEMTGFKKE